MSDKSTDNLAGYAIIDRAKVTPAPPEVKQGDNQIFFWRKMGNTVKCDGYTPMGWYAEGIGESLVESLKDWAQWADIMDMDGVPDESPMPPPRTASTGSFILFVEKQDVAVYRGMDEVLVAAAEAFGFGASRVKIKVFP